MRKAENPIDLPRGTPWKMQSGELTGTITDRKRMTGKIGGKAAPYPHLRIHSHDRITGTGREVSKVNIQEVLFTPADAAGSPRNHRMAGTRRARHHPRPFDVQRPPPAAPLVARETHAQPHAPSSHRGGPRGNRASARQPAPDNICRRPRHQRGRTNPAESQAQAVEGRHRTNPTCPPPHLRRTNLDRHRQTELQVRPARRPIRTRNSTGKPGGRCNPT